MIARGMPPGLAEALTPYGSLDVLWLVALAVLALTYVVGVGMVLRVNAAVMRQHRESSPRWSWSRRERLSVAWAWVVAVFMAVVWPGFSLAAAALGLAWPSTRRLE